MIITIPRSRSIELILVFGGINKFTEKISACCVDPPYLVFSTAGIISSRRFILPAKPVRERQAYCTRVAFNNKIFGRLFEIGEPLHLLRI